MRSFGATPIIDKVVEKRSLSSLSALADREGDRVAVVGSSLAIILRLDRTTVRDGSIRPASKESKFYYTTHYKDKICLLRYA